MCRGSEILSKGRRAVMDRRRKIIGIVLLVLIFIALALSLDYILVNEEHECTGGGCEVCAVLQRAEDTLSGSSAREAAAVAVFTIALVSGAALLIRAFRLRTASSPVSLFDVLIA